MLQSLCVPHFLLPEARCHIDYDPDLEGEGSLISRDNEALYSELRFYVGSEEQAVLLLNDYPTASTGQSPSKEFT